MVHPNSSTSLNLTKVLKKKEGSIHKRVEHVVKKKANGRT